MTGSVLDWMDSVGLCSIEEALTLAQQVEDNGDVYFVPSFSGKSGNSRVYF